ncbi:hypothetical protein [Shewanella sp. Isolate7]|uniref:hypothetical protein n=1 Tax=Shewanella sp. Isolate7 TaxID=2908528 RepID=UPI001EFEE9F9|nr:hypothetical protein [Shewanella sp. Isolate7]MCG9723188.1 hypothetical protein [Shewanella sp. Isolate7]
MTDVSFKKVYSVDQLTVLLLCFLASLPFYIFLEKFPPDQVGKAIVISLYIPILFIWLCYRIYRMYRDPSLVVLKLDANSVEIDGVSHGIERLKYLNVVFENDHFKLEWELRSEKQIWQAQIMRTCAHYVTDVPINEIKSLTESFNKLSYFDNSSKLQRS